MKTLTELIADARATHDIRDVLGLRSNERVIVCPLPQHTHKHYTPSFSIFWRRNMQWWRCHGNCDTEGDIIDLIGYLRVTGYIKTDPDHIRQALNLLEERYNVVIPQPEPEIVLKGGEWRQYFPPKEEVIEYAKSRGLLPETLMRFKIGQYEHFMAMPCFEEGILKGIKMRNIWECDPKRRFWQLEGSRMGLFNFDAVNLKDGCTFIVKGEIPVMAMDQLGFPQSCAPTGGEASGQKNISHWMTALALSARCVIGDNDAPGIELAKKRTKLFDTALHFPPEQFKDLDEWILADPEDAIRELRFWQNKTLSEWW